jgi:uncharacterized SAM-binding protein YcdF (DUF218 family)
MIRWLLFIALAWVVFVFLPDIPPVRNLLASPLVVKDRDPQGDACYILAADDAFRERLGAAAELYNQGRISRIIFMREDVPSSYNYVAKALWTQTEWALDFLTHRGVPRDRIQLIDHVRGPFGTLQEARNLKKFRPPDLKRLVLVSSAPHMRRSVLAFRRVFPPDIAIVSCPASKFVTSYEYFYPLWIEYLKLAVYAVVAR